MYVQNKIKKLTCGVSRQNSSQNVLTYLKYCNRMNVIFRNLLTRKKYHDDLEY